MKTISNQKIITVERFNEEDAYEKINLDCMYKAMNKLIYNEFKIYMYMITNQDNYEFALSTKDIADKTGANQRELQKCINSLIRKGYMINTNGNNFIFNEDNEVSKNDIEIL